MNQFIGQKCSEAIAREFWLHGELVSNCCCIFLRFGNDTLIKILYNDESHRWEAKESDDETSIKNPLGDAEFFYPHKPISGLDSAGLIFNGYTEDPCRNWSLKFSGGLALHLIHEQKTDETRYEVRI
jgi:hypothetical protein